MKNEKWRSAIIRHGKGKAIAFLTVLSTTVSLVLTATVHLAFGSDMGPIALVTSILVPSVLAPMIGSVHISLIIELQRAEARALESAAVDPLTGLFNRRAFLERSASAMDLCTRNSFPVSLIYLDLDRFKRVNDTFGHGTGDLVLKAFASLLKTSMRRTDVIGRIGGEEFAVFLINTRQDDAYRLAEKIRLETESADFPTVEGRRLRMTVSAGATSSESESRKSLENLIASADRSLYRAKESGRNRVCLDEPGEKSEEASLALEKAV